MNHVFLRIILTVFLFQAFVANAALPGHPIIFFSDLVSAPSSGWSTASPNKGAVVTIWGRNFGSTRGSSFVTVNGVSLHLDSDYFDTWGKSNNPVPFLQTITFQLDNSMPLGNGSISVSVNGNTSNDLPFRINSSNISFVDNSATAAGTGTLDNPYSDPMSFINSMQPGDVLYFRGGLYDEKTDGGKATIWVRDSKTNGTAQDPIGMVAYPGEDVHVDSLNNGDVSNFNRSFQSNISYLTIAKFRTTSHLRGIWTSSYNRVIGNEVTGVVDHAGGDGAIHTGSQGPVILGNSVHGARSGNKLDHGIYIDGCQHIDGAEIAYNYLWDNDVGLGPLMVDNHQNTRCSADVYMKSNHWHHNLLSAENYPTRCLGIYDLSWDSGESREPDPAYIYNNIFIGCGDGWNGAVYHNNGYAFILNNTFINSKGKSIQIFDNASDERVLGVTIVNNLMIQAPGVTQSAIENNGSTESLIDVDHNYYENSSPYISDDNSVSGSANLTVNPASYNPVIVNTSSPIINHGSSSVSDTLSVDFYGVNRALTCDIGAVEYTGSGMVATTRPNPPILFVD